MATNMSVDDCELEITNRYKDSHPHVYTLTRPTQIFNTIMTNKDITGCLNVHS